jgi:hypothetical protein
VPLSARIDILPSTTARRPWQISFPKFKVEKDLYHEASCCYLAISIKHFPGITEIAEKANAVDGADF